MLGNTDVIWLHKTSSHFWDLEKIEEITVQEWLTSESAQRYIMQKSERKVQASREVQEEQNHILMKR